MSDFNGNDIRELRKNHRLTRKEMGDLLSVSAVTVEKWEQKSNQKIRPKYHEKLMEIAGAGIAGAGIGVLAAPALLPIADVLGLGAIGLACLVSDTELEKASATIEKLKRLSSEEREIMIQLVKKMNTQQ